VNFNNEQVNGLKRKGKTARESFFDKMLTSILIDNSRKRRETESSSEGREN